MSSSGCFALTPADFSQYRGYTFPAYRYLLELPAQPQLLAMGLQCNGLPVGLALGFMQTSENVDGVDGANPPNTAVLASIFLVPEQRGRGQARVLLQAWLEHAQRAGAETVQVTWRSGQPTTGALEALLKQTGWSPPQTRMLLVEATLESIAPAPWMQPQALPADTRIVPWQQVSSAQREALWASHCAEPWIAPDLIPFAHEAGFEPHTSLALLRGGDVVGWVLNHAHGETLRFTCSFMHPRLQGLGRVTLLYRESVLRAGPAGFARAMWTVPLWHPRMVRFAQRWMAPYATRFDETRGAQHTCSPSR